MKRVTMFLLGILCINYLFSQPLNKGKEAIKVLLITGSELPRHAVTLVKPEFYKMLFSYEEILWDHATSIEDILSNNLEDKYDVIIMFSYHSDLSSSAKYNLNKFLESGKGLIAFHSQVAAFEKWEWWWKEVTGAKYQYTPSDKYPTSKSERPITYKLQKASAHPINYMIEDFEINDEAYQQLTFVENIQPIFTTNSPKSDNNVIWIGPNKSSRVVVFAPGHGPDIYKNETFKEVFHRAILWVSYNI